MIDRVTFHVRDGIAVTGVGKIYDPAKRKTRTMAGAVIRLAEYEDTGLDPCEIVKLKEQFETDKRIMQDIGYVHVDALATSHFHFKMMLEAALKDLHGSCSVCKHYTPYHGKGLCADCKYDFDEGEEEDRWEWRGPQQEET